MNITSSDVDSHLFYADPDPQKLMNADPDPGQKNHQIEFKPSFIWREFFSSFKSVPNP